MDPVEAGDWIKGRPLQLVFLTGLDPANKPHHSSIVNAFRNRSEDKPPLQIRVVSGELEIPPKREQGPDKGILRRNWPLKYLTQVPALIVIFVDLDWNHPSWEEKKTEAESKVASIRAQLRHGTKLALVMIQQRTTNANDNQAADRAHEIANVCSLAAKQLFVLPIQGEVQNYVAKLENAFHEISQSFYQQRLKHIRSRSIPNNSPALVVRQQLKLAFLSELRQDTHTALRNYRLAYDQCKDTLEQWDGVDVFEWRSVVGLLNYKMCELCFLHSTALEAINQMRKHTTVFFSSPPGIYPTPHLASIELLLWKAKQCYHFAQLFERAVAGGLSALATLNPGTHLDQAANIYAAANTEISALKRSMVQNVAYPSPDPLENAANTEFFGQRPWRIGHEGLASADVEAAAVSAISQRLVINHEGVISLLTAAMAQYKKYGCVRMQKKVMIEMANTCYANNDIPKALQLWALVVRDSALPYAVRKDMMHRATWAAYAIASVKEFAVCCLQLMTPAYADVLPCQCAQAFGQMLTAQVPCSPFPADDVTQAQLQSYQQQWQKVLSERSKFTVQASRIECFVETRVSFLEEKTVDRNSRVAVRIELISKIEQPFKINDVSVFVKAKGSTPETSSDIVNFDEVHLGAVEISKSQPMKKIVFFDVHKTKENMILTVSKVVLDIGCPQVSGKIEFDENALNRNLHEENIIGLEFLKIGPGKPGVILENVSKVDCLIGEVTSTELVLRNTSRALLSNLRLDFKRSEQKFTEAAAVLFVEKEGTELKSEFSMNVCDVLNVNQTIKVPLMFSAQLTGTYTLQLELNYKQDDNSELRDVSTILDVEVTAKDPFVVSSHVMNMNGIPMTSILNNCEHVLNVSIQSTASICISAVEFLMADVVTISDTVNGGAGKELNDEVHEDEVLCYSAVIRVLVKEEETETPLGRLSIDWKRSAPNSFPVRSVVPLCRIPVLACPLAIKSHVKTSSPTVRQPIEICFELTNHVKEALEITTNFDLNDVFMFSGERKVTVTVLPGNMRRITVIVMALSAGRLNFPKLSLKSPQVPDQVLQQALRALPATIFVLPKGKEMQLL
uniref:Foie-gras_1 domain-containing protein n=1 Tax=Caenorhabditis japonica TaxID=281687 RepID=A0A8R1I1D9_CAEJA